MTDGHDLGEMAGVSVGTIILQPVDDGAPFIATLMQTAKENSDGTLVHTRSLIIPDVMQGQRNPGNPGDPANIGPVITAARPDIVPQGDPATDPARKLVADDDWLYQDAPIGIIFVDLDGTIISQNAAFGTLMGNIVRITRRYFDD